MPSLLCPRILLPRRLSLPRQALTLTTFASCQIGKGSHGTFPRSMWAAHTTFLSDGVWTLHRLAAAGYDLAGLSPQCPLCGLHPDTAHDRLFTCSHTAALRSSLLTAADLHTLRDPAFAVEAAGWVLRPPPPPTEEETPQSQIMCLGGDTMSFSECVALPWHDAFVNGTCTMHAHHPAYRRSAWAVVLQTEPTATFAAALVGPVNSP